MRYFGVKRIRERCLWQISSSGHKVMAKKRTRKAHGTESYYEELGLQTKACHVTGVLESGFAFMKRWPFEKYIRRDSEG